MKTYAPTYYPQFRCIADRCKHSCCVGWEIDIDADTYHKYQTFPGKIGERLRANITVSDGVASFIPAEGDRCPFLNETGLCDLILAGGEALLCEICDRHPRFYHWFQDCTEVGLGLCCEAAADLIIGQKEPMRLVCVEQDAVLEDETEVETEWMREDRETILSMLQDRSRDVKQRIEQVLKLFVITEPELSLQEWISIYLQLESLDPKWKLYLRGLQAADWSDLSLAPIAAEQLLCYFIYRHYSDGLEDDCYAKHILFAYLSTQMIFTLTEAYTDGVNEQNLAEMARMYSAEIEYSTKNLEQIWDILDRLAE